MKSNLAPYLRVRGAAAALDFYAKAFGAVETMRLVENPGGRIGHAEMRIGDGMVMLSDEYPEMGIVGPESLGGSAVGISFEVDDVDALVARAEAAGAKVLMAPRDEFYGHRAGKLEDPFGHVWHVSTRLENLSEEELQRRYDALMAEG